MVRVALASIFVLAAAGCGKAEERPTVIAATWCAELPRPANVALKSVKVDSPWFVVYEVEPGVFALAEPNQFQEAISYLLLGNDRAVLFDTGLGVAPIRPVVEQLTKLPVTVINSHTHYDHVGGNAEFETILAVDDPYTRANQAGFVHAELATEVAAGSFCHGPPAGLDTAAFRTRPWRPSGRVKDTDSLDLGGRVLQVLQVPGHTPDALALFDRANGLLLTGDTYYDGTLWLYVPETDLDAYEKSIARLQALGGVRRLLPAHNGASADPAKLAGVIPALRSIRTGQATGDAEPNGRMTFKVEGYWILTSKALLEGKRGDRTRGGSGLTVWP